MKASRGPKEDAAAPQKEILIVTSNYTSAGFLKSPRQYIYVLWVLSGKWHMSLKRLKMKVVALRK